MTSDQNPTTQPTWIIIEPGLIELATTKIRIRHHSDRAVPYTLEWNSGDGWAYGNLEAAKRGALERLNELLLMGCDP